MSRLLSDPFTHMELERAAAEPLEADLLALFATLDDHLKTLPLGEQLAEAGRWLARLADLYVTRADLWLDGWHNKYHPTEPVLSEDFLSRWVIHTQSLDLGEWLDDPDPHYYPADRNSPTTMVAAIDKDELLAWVDAHEDGADLPEVLEIPEDEDPTAWMAALANFWRQHTDADPIPWPELCNRVGLPPGALMLAVLLGGYPHHRAPGTEFYDNQGVWVQTLG
jgi:hypothetical protein